MAKGVEDTAFYRYAGCWRSTTWAATPARFGLSVDAFHAANAERARALPAQPARHPDARHEALGRRAGADRRAVGDADRVGERVRRWFDADAPLREAAGARPTGSSST